jgi:hypothetical protein
MNRYLPLFACGLLVLFESGRAQAPCPEGSLWEPYTEICAPVRDVQSDFLPLSQKSTAAHSDAPVPAGGIAAGIEYPAGQLVAMASGRLHTRMFVYPDGLERSGALPAWLYTTATSRVDDGIELLAMYSETLAAGYLGLYSWTCLPDYPCPNGDTDRDWQWSRALPELSCNMTQVVDQGGHAQKQLYYANHSDRLDNGTPPLWRSAAYLWNYCDAAWDLAWEHQYRQDKGDCSVAGSNCAWWGPSIEIFGETMYPEVGELGYEDSLLYHDGTWSRLLPPEAQFRDPSDSALVPWQLFHLEANRSYGVGNLLDESDRPLITGQAALSTAEQTELLIGLEHFTVEDSDSTYPDDFTLTVYDGQNYTRVGNTITPATGYSGTLSVPVTVNDGTSDSPVFTATVSVVPVINAPPVIVGQQPIETLERSAVEITLDYLVIADPDNDIADLAIRVLDGDGYQRSGNVVTPEPGVIGSLYVDVVANDGILDSEVFTLMVKVLADTVPPEITLLGSATVTVQQGSNYIDSGATAIDNVDGDVSARIVVDDPVDTGIPGTYTVTYSVADLAGNGSIAARTVIVQSTVTPPPQTATSGGGALSLWPLCLLSAVAGAVRLRAGGHAVAK